MKTFYITLALIHWMIFTFILAVSVIGLLVLAPQMNNTYQHIPQERLRGTWMRIGHELMNKLINI